MCFRFYVDANKKATFVSKHYLIAMISGAFLSTCPLWGYLAVYYYTKDGWIDPEKLYRPYKVR